MATVLLFGRLADIAGWRTRDMGSAPSCVSEIKTLISQDNPEFRAALDDRGVRVAVDRVLIQGDAPVPANAEVAFMPAMSGG